MDIKLDHYREVRPYSSIVIYSIITTFIAYKTRKQTAPVNEEYAEHNAGYIEDSEEL